jgi:hypothetical protein
MNVSITVTLLAFGGTALILNALMAWVLVVR